MIEREEFARVELDPEKRSAAEAILARSASGAPGARRLEEALALVAVGASEAAGTLLTVLPYAVVYVLMEEEEDWSTVLVLDDEEGNAHLGIFTSEDHAMAAATAFERDYQARSIDMVLLGRCVEGELGLAFNMNDEVMAFELSTEIFGLLRGVMARFGEPESGRMYSVLRGESGYHAVRVLEMGAPGEAMMVEVMETGWQARPEEVTEDMMGLAPSAERLSVSREAFMRWLPLRLTEI